MPVSKHYLSMNLFNCVALCSFKKTCRKIRFIYVHLRIIFSMITI